jgi:hypothetical protein
MGINDLDSVVNEMDVQDRYRVAFRNAFKDIIFESKFRTDGLAYSEKNKLRMIIEQKHGYNFASMVERAKVVAQVIRYIKTIHDEDPKIMPKVAVIGDENECFVLPVKDIINYISVKEYNWSLSPSSMHQDKVLVDDLTDDNVIKQLYIYKPQNEFGEIVNKIKDINKGVSVPRTLTEKNIDRVYEYFTDKITLKRLGKKISPNDSVNLFAHIMLHPNSVMLNNHTKQLFTGMFKEPLSVSNVESYNSFITEFSRTYTPKQKHIFTAILDRLIEDTTRRKQGEFFTPTIWVNKSYEYITSVYGDDWKEKYVVWDPAWGTGNLTRDYDFKELYASTLNQSDIDIANQMNYNPNAKKFRFDFLNDSYESLPQGLRNAIESGRRIIVLMNSPYGKPTPNNSLSSEDKSTSKGMANTVVGLEMNNDKMGIASSQLYLQFMYRLQKMGVEICMFSTPGFISQISNKSFRTKFLSKYSLTKGFIMNSSEFADVKSWGLTFSILTPTESENKFSFKYDILEKTKNSEKNDDSYIITKTGEKVIYNTDNKTTLSEWMESDLPKNNIEYPVFESALGISDKLKKGNRDAVGYINNDSNNNQQQNVIHLMSGVCKANGNKPITKDNFDRMITGFAARKLIKRFWLTDKDEFIKPNISDDNFNKFKYDSYVYSIFHIHSYQTSVRGVNYNNSNWDVKNNFFWMSKNETTELANQNNYNELYNDARTDSDRYVHTLLFGEEGVYNQLSTEAKDVLDSATNLVRLSLERRREFANDTNHLNSWDAGYAQLKLLWKEYYPEQFKELRAKYKVLEDKMRPMVYELGFLLK